MCSWVIRGDLLGASIGGCDWIKKLTEEWFFLLLLVHYNNDTYLVCVINTLNLFYIVIHMRIKCYKEVDDHEQ